MWIPIFTAALSAFLDSLPNSGQVRRALGLPGDSDRQLSFHSIPDVGAFFVPIRLWADGGGIWRAVSPEGVEFLYEFFKNRYYRVGDLDFSFDFDEVPPSLAYFVYFDGQSKLPVAAWVSGPHVDYFRPESFWPDQRKRFDLGILRFRTFLLECFSQTDSFEPDAHCVPMPVPDFFPDLINRLESGENSEVPPGFSSWKRECLDGQAAFNDLNHLQSQLREIVRLSRDPLSEESVGYLIDAGLDTEDLSKKEAEHLFYTSSYELVSGISEALRYLESRRYSEASRLVSLLTTFPFATDAFSHLEAMRFTLGDPHDPVDVLEVVASDERTDAEDADVSVSFDSGARSFTDGVAKSLLDMGYLETESNLMKRIGTPIFSFPGELQGEWIFRCAIDDSIQIDGGEDLHLFLLIARDHGLLSGIVSELWSPTLDSLSDGVVSAFLARTKHRRIRR